jgi:hypothetical protein
MISSKAPSGDILHARIPQPHHWRTLVAEDERLILSPEEFLSRWAITALPGVMRYNNSN